MAGFARQAVVTEAANGWLVETYEPPITTGDGIYLSQSRRIMRVFTAWPEVITFLCDFTGLHG